MIYCNTLDDHTSLITIQIDQVVDKSNTLDSITSINKILHNISLIHYIILQMLFNIN